MGIFKAAGISVGKNLADQWKEVIEPANMGIQTLMTKGVSTGRKTSNTKGNADIVSNGSVIHVYDNQFMMLTDGGRVIDYTAEPGYFQVNNSSAPSLFNGQLSEAVRETFSRFGYGGEPSGKQMVFYLNLQEIKGIKFGTINPVNYFDSFYNAELFLKAHGSYSIKITDPLKFYAEVVPRNASQLEVRDINEQFLAEFLEAFQASINQMSLDGTRISYVLSKGPELSKYMADALDDDWHKMRGVEIQSVGIAGISYTDESQELINMRNKGAMLSDPGIREGYVQGSVARGIEAAGSNENGAMAGLMGVGMGLQGTSGFMGAASQANMEQMKMQTDMAGSAQQSAKSAWVCGCGAVNDGNFCSTCGAKKPDNGSWKCSCGAENNGNFCSNCGKKRP